MKEYYSLPLPCAEWMKTSPKLTKVKLEESVRRHIFLMLTTRFGELRFDHTYGCKVWEHDFENLKTLELKKPELEVAIKNLLLRHEARLSEPDVKISITETPITDPLQTTKLIKKKIEVKIKGRLAETNKVFEPKPFVIFFTPVNTEGSNFA